MTEIKAIEIAKIFVPERLRAVEDDHALAIQASIVQHGLLNPITVRSTPNQGKGKKPFTLVAGAHRLRAMELNNEAEIDAIVVEADNLEAQLIEIEENVFRNDLSALDRAVFIQTYRDVWEQKHGKIRRGGDRKSAEYQTANLAELMLEEAEKGFSAYCAERLGFSKRSIERAQQIALNLPKPFREKLRGTPAANNQSLLMRYAALPPEKRAQAAEAIDHAEGDPVAALDLLLARKAPSSAQKREAAVISNYAAMGKRERIKCLRELRKMYPADFAALDAEGGEA